MLSDSWEVKFHHYFVVWFQSSMKISYQNQCLFAVRKRWKVRSIRSYAVTDISLGVQ
jgi:hypothetical protein